MKKQNYLDCLVGVFGQPVAENPGVVIQEAAFKALELDHWRFLTIDVDKDQLENAIKGLKAFKMRGINCTIPHKIAVMEYLDEISESARMIGAVNTIINDGGQLFGENTDGKGFMMSLASSGVQVEGQKAVVFGAGGAARAICVEMALAGVKTITIVNRPQDRTLGDELVSILTTRTNVEVLYEDWHGLFPIPANTNIVIHATSVGLYPDVHVIPHIDLDTLSSSMFVQDVIPNPIETALIKELCRRGIPCSTGAGMLVNQAALNIEMWTGLKPDKTLMLEALEKAVQA
ncbi:shikimate dehydrogenase [Parasphaerochaeta coccoides]|uniref:Shikimate dehydrogenase (NADP(+)) n=1 Tax=Parasphaerochaeta coccoides (strain ATCC BAA-1237 / DSM 17374 / SPN1) TaxID=760011 RepID=F4GJT1_PARC1|nr:shikimate dehydrogenase [Parasphaerochaeta coccoides]AEC01356.1 Shikimate dehydrogenase [Parasphaerochaeta coccoides DSM 17374]